MCGCFAVAHPSLWSQLFQRLQRKPPLWPSDTFRGVSSLCPVLDTRTIWYPARGSICHTHLTISLGVVSGRYTLWTLSPQWERCTGKDNSPYAYPAILSPLVAFPVVYVETELCAPPRFEASTSEFSPHIAMLKVRTLTTRPPRFHTGWL